MESTCVQCNEIFQAQRRTARYCSRPCRHRHQGADRKTTRRARNRQAISARRARPLTADERLRLAWLAGFLDGEGTIALSHGSRKTPNLRIVVYNTARPVVEKACRLLDDLEVAYFVRWDRRYDNHCASIRIGNDGALWLHPLIRPYLVRQVERYDAAVEFLGERYRDRLRVWWSPEDLVQWEQLRTRFNVK